MSPVLGDCCLKVAEEQQSVQAGMEPGAVGVQRRDGQASLGQGYGQQPDHTSQGKPGWLLPSDNSFQVDSTLSETDPETAGTPLEAAPGAEQTQTSVRGTEQENQDRALSFAATGQEPKFAFNFAIPEEGSPLAPLVPGSQHTEGAADPQVQGDSLPPASEGVLEASALQKPALTHTAGTAAEEDGSHVMLNTPRPEAAPGAKAVAEKSTADGAAQKKKKKKKQKPSVSKKEVEETEINKKAKEEANRCQNKDTSHQDKTSQQSDDQLWKEIDWCVEQLELGLKTQKSTPKQMQEALQAIKTLRSDKAPLVKKRQVMRTIFGDYRKKMEEEWCRELKLMEAAVKSARVVEVKGNARNKTCQFVRKRSGACRKSQDAAGPPLEPPRTLNTGSFKFTASQEEFRFNFF